MAIFPGKNNRNAQADQPDTAASTDPATSSTGTDTVGAPAQTGPVTPGAGVTGKTVTTTASSVLLLGAGIAVLSGIGYSLSTATADESPAPETVAAGAEQDAAAVGNAEETTTVTATTTARPGELGRSASEPVIGQDGIATVTEEVTVTEEPVEQEAEPENAEAGVDGEPGEGDNAEAGAEAESDTGSTDVASTPGPEHDSAPAEGAETGAGVGTETGDQAGASDHVPGTTCAQMPENPEGTWDPDTYGKRSVIPQGADYFIQCGDTLARIADRAGVDMWKLAAHNGIENPDVIYAETTISIPMA